MSDIQLLDALTQIRREIRRAALLNTAHKISAAALERGDYHSDAESAREAVALYRAVEKEESR